MDFFKRRYHVLYPTRVDLDDHEVPSYWKTRPAREVYPGSNYEFELGGTKFVVIAPENTGEGEDGVLLWLPKERILFTADFNVPREGQRVSPSIATLVQNLDRLKLDFDRHVMVHAPDPDRPMTRADLYALAKEAR